MEVFSNDTFRQFLGQANCKMHSWGREERYFVSESSLISYLPLLTDTIYHHHSSFDSVEELIGLGFPLVAQAMRSRHSGNPENSLTQIGNLGEVLGREFAKAFLGFDENIFFQKDLTPILINR